MMPELIHSNGWDHPPVAITHPQMNQLLTTMKEKNIGVNAALHGVITANQNINLIHYDALNQRLQKQPPVKDPNSSTVMEINKLALHLLDPKNKHSSVVGPFHPVETLFQLKAIAGNQEIEKIEKELVCDLLSLFAGCCFSLSAKK